MASLNKIILLGNLTRDPELRYAPNGTPVTRFGLAVNTSRAGQGDERKEEVCFVDIVAFGRQAETASEYLSKGRPALVEGRLQWRSWEGQDGQKRSKHEVIAERIQFMPRGREEGTERTSPSPSVERTPPGPSRAGEEMDFAPPLEDDDIPF
jgi:single-strand DNA-binding protein